MHPARARERCVETFERGLKRGQPVKKSSLIIHANDPHLWYGGAKIIGLKLTTLRIVSCFVFILINVHIDFRACQIYLTICFIYLQYFNLLQKIARAADKNSRWITKIFRRETSASHGQACKCARKFESRLVIEIDICASERYVSMKNP